MNEIYATDYGVVADGVTDDRSAVLTAIAACSGGGRLIFPSGVMRIAGHDAAGWVLNFPYNNVIYEGQGESTVFLYDDNTVAAFIRSVGTTGVAFKGFTIDGNGKSGHGFRGGDNDGLLVEDLLIQNTLGYGVGLEEGTLKRIKLHKLDIRHTYLDGIDIKNANSNNEAIVVDKIDVSYPGEDPNSTTETAFDFRGVVRASNLSARHLKSNVTGIRFREDGISPSGAGGHRSSCVNFYVEAEDDQVTNTYGVYVPASYVNVANGNIVNCNQGLVFSAAYNSADNVAVSGGDTAYLIDTNAAYGEFTSCRNKNSGKGFVVKGDYTSMVGCKAVGNTNEGLNINVSSDGAVLVGNTFRSNGVANIKNGTNIVQSGNFGY